jgi:hypothetical protein
VSVYVCVGCVCQPCIESFKQSNKEDTGDSSEVLATARGLHLIGEIFGEAEKGCTGLAERFIQ